MAAFEQMGDPGEWDQGLAEALIGASLLVGLSFVDTNDRLIRREQLFGIVAAVDRAEGIVIRQDDGEEVAIAPALHAIEAAAPGVYRLRDSGREIENPDYTAMLIVRAPVRH